MAASTRPLTLGEILDRTVLLYRRNFLLFAGISFLPSAIYVLVSGVASIYFSSQMPLVPQAAPPNMQAMLALGLFAVVFLLVGLPLLLIVLAVALSALNYAAFQRNRGDSTTVRAAYAYGFRHFWRHVGILFLQFLFAGVLPGAIFAVALFVLTMLTALIATTAGKAFAVLGGLLIVVLGIAVFVVCVWIWLRFCLAYPASATEEKKAWASLQRSAQLSKGSRGRIFVMYLMVAIMTVVAYYVLTLPVDIALKLTIYKSMDAGAILTRPPILLQVVNLFVNCLERTFVLPIYSIALLLFYNDQRTRQEGYDIELLMANAGWSQLPAAQAMPPAPEPAPALDPAPPEIAPLQAEPVHPASEGTDA
jgi:Membrane domain of glycerophosphoryl diester phosphodiesterase